MSRSPDDRNPHDPPARKVLVVDDEPTLRLGFAYALSGRGTIVDTAGTGREAVEKLALHHYDILILDLRMPDMDGMAVVEALRGRRDTVPIVLCSAAISAAVVCKAIGLGVVDFLQKPVRPADLREIVHFVLGTKQAPLPLAMEAARQGRYRDAVTHLEKDTDLPAESVAWRDIFKSMPPPDDRDSLAVLVEFIRSNLGFISFRAR